MKRAVAAFGWLLAGAATACAQDAASSSLPAANPARPTVTNPATLPPVGYLQFEQGYLGALNSPNTDTQYGVVQTVKLTVHPRVMVQEQSQPFARSVVDGAASRDAGDVLLGGELVVFTPHESEDQAVKDAKDRHRHTYVKAATPTVTMSYLGRVHAGTAADLDMGSFRQSLAVLASGHAPLVDVHYDTNLVVSEQVDDSGVRRAQFGETLSVDRDLGTPNLQGALEVYHFSQPFVSSTAGGRPVGKANVLAGLFAVSYSFRPNLVVDAGFSHGFTSTSTRWQSFAGFTYVLPKRLWPERKG